MEIQHEGTTVNMTKVIEQIDEATKNREFDDAFVVGSMGNLWEACRTYLMRFEITMLEKEGTPIDIADWKPVDWDQHVRDRLGFVARKYGYAEITAVVKGVEYKVVVGQTTRSES